MTKNKNDIIVHANYLSAKTRREITKAVSTLNNCHRVRYYASKAMSKIEKHSTFDEDDIITATTFSKSDVQKLAQKLWKMGIINHVDYKKNVFGGELSLKRLYSDLQIAYDEHMDDEPFIDVSDY